MRGKITRNGVLAIWRGDDYKRQTCPHDIACCGDLCPLFGEPYVIEYGYRWRNMQEMKTTRLELCKRTWVFDEFEDQRNKGEEP